MKKLSPLEIVLLVSAILICVVVVTYFSANWNSADKAQQRLNRTLYGEDASK
jgi:hypothetical protein